MAEVASQWQLDVERGPAWLIVKLIPPEVETQPEPNLFDSLWSLVERHFIYRVVLEMQSIPRLSSDLIGQLILLENALGEHDGTLRLCGLSETCQQSLQRCQLEAKLRVSGDRTEAVLGNHPPFPR